MPKQISTTEPLELTSQKKHMALGVQMALTGLASGYMSLQGAQAVFDSYLLSIPFAVAVQGAVLSSLWLLPKKAALMKGLLFSSWAVAVFFSVSSAYVVSTQASSEELAAAQAKSEIVTWVSSVREHGSRLSSQVARHEAQATCEITEGCVKIPDKGPRYRKATQEAAQARAALTLYQESAGQAIAELEAKLVALGSETDVAQLRSIYSTYRAQVPSQYQSGIPLPTFVTKVSDWKSRLLEPYFAITEGTKEEKLEAVLGVSLASLMEALAFLFAMMRLTLDRPKDERSMRARLVDWVARLKALGNVDKHSTDWAEHLEDEEALRLALEKKGLEERRKETLPKRVSPKTPRTPRVNWSLQWSKAQALDAYNSGISESELVRDLLTLRARYDKDKEELFSEKSFDKLPALLRALIESEVLQPIGDGQMKRGKRFGDWLHYLFEQLPGPVATSTMHLVRTGT